jgi:hypothetical protein
MVTPVALAGWSLARASRENIVLRIIHGRTGGAPRVVQEQAFIAEIEALRSSGGIGEALPCTVESVDGLGRLRWRAYCSTLQGLLDLARELGEERSMARDDGGRDRAS